jgi:hypothetical protein
MNINDYLRNIWIEKVDSSFMYRGMSSRAITDPIKYNLDPFKGIKSKLLEILRILKALSAAGCQFKIVERHGDREWQHDLGNIVDWSIRDLNEPGLDFISERYDAMTYADNFQGSQLRQNMKYITENLDIPDKRAKALITELKESILRSDPGHEGVVLWVKRSNKVFDNCKTSSLCLGSFEYFSEKVLLRLKEKGMLVAMDSIEQVIALEVPKFCCRVVKDLYLKDIYKIEKTKL